MFLPMCERQGREGGAARSCTERGNLTRLARKWGVLGIPENPKGFGAGLIEHTLNVFHRERQGKRKARRGKALKVWREILAAQALAGHKEALRILKQADMPHSNSNAQRGTEQILQDKQKLWSDLPGHEEGRGAERRNASWCSMT